jgi:molybdopterin adenylyltransferase
VAANVTGSGRRAFVLTVSDGVAAGVREDSGGAGVAGRLEELGFAVVRGVTADEPAEIAAAIVAAAADHDLVLTTGGTGLTPRDVTPQATKSVLEYEIPGLSELMRSTGGRAKPQAYLSRSVAGVRTRCLIVNLPGSPRGALESLAAIEPILEHALATLAGPFDHDTTPRGDAEPRG